MTVNHALTHTQDNDWGRVERRPGLCPGQFLQIRTNIPRKIIREVIVALRHRPGTTNNNNNGPTTIRNVFIRIDRIITTTTGAVLREGGCNRSAALLEMIKGAFRTILVGRTVRTILRAVTIARILNDVIQGSVGHAGRSVSTATALGIFRTNVGSEIDPQTNDHLVLSEAEGVPQKTQGYTM